jgi:hypothetical protein
MVSTSGADAAAKFERLRAKHPRLDYHSCWFRRDDDALCFGLRFLLAPAGVFTPTTVVTGLDPQRRPR